MGALPWAGFAGLDAALKHIRRFNDMGHALLANIREVCRSRLPAWMGGIDPVHSPFGDDLLYVGRWVCRATGS